MSKEKVFIVMSHKHSLKSKTKVASQDDWQTHETVEFVNQLRPHHLHTSSVVADYINRTIMVGARHNMTYERFEELVRSKYADQMAQLDTAYNSNRVPEVVDTTEPLFTDQFGNVRAKTVFDR